MPAPFKNALVSVSDKTGLVDFLKPLVKNGLRVVSTGGTAKHLQENGIPVVSIQEQTGFPEVMDGRVKTLHPRVHMALLARQDNPEHMEVLKQNGLEPFDLVIVNLYPFDAKAEVENIDVGGPSMLRAAAKNFASITTIVDVNDYAWVAQKESELTFEERQKLASKVFYHLSSYDAMIANWLAKGGESQKAESLAPLPQPYVAVGGAHVSELRYGENPQQKAAWYRLRGATSGLHEATILQGKALSYNNILDLDAAIKTVQEFSRPACVAVKHNNPCGIAEADTIVDAVIMALKADPVSIFGGILALNRELDESSARAFSEIFLECIVAPKFSKAALEVFAKKKNLRLLEWSQMLDLSRETQYRSVLGGFLAQDPDQVTQQFNEQWKVLGQTPDELTKRDLLFAWKAVAHLKSNAIAIAANGQTLGLGMGQVNRVDAVEQAISRMNQFHGPQSKAVLASDAFFPFADSIEKIAKAGIKWVIQPGGSVNDESVIAKAQECGVNMVLTGTRHFMH